MSTTPEAEVVIASSDPERTVPRRSLSLLRPQSPVPTWLGIAFVIAGFALLGLAWGGVAGEGNVALQMPYLISGGMVGLGLILVGLTIVNVAAKRRDSAQREQQIQLLAAALAELKNQQEGE